MSVRNQVHIELALDPETQILCAMICAALSAEADPRVVAQLHGRLMLKIHALPSHNTRFEMYTAVRPVAAALIVCDVIGRKIGQECGLE